MPNSRRSFMSFARAPRTPDLVGTNLRPFTLTTGRISRASTPDMWRLHSLSWSLIRPRRRWGNSGNWCLMPLQQALRWWGRMSFGKRSATHPLANGRSSSPSWRPKGVASRGLNPTHQLLLLLMGHRALGIHSLFRESTITTFNRDFP